MKKFRKCCIAVSSILAGVAAGAVGMGMIAGKALDGQEIQTRQAQSYYEVLNQWLTLKYRGISLEQYFLKNNYATIAIYGFTELCKRLDDELRNSEAVKVAYIIDRNPNGINTDKNVYGLFKELPPVDAVIVTPVFEFYEIDQMLSKIISCPVLSLEEILKYEDD